MQKDKKKESEKKALFACSCFYVYKTKKAQDCNPLKL